jgi:hypothetical protein
MFKKSILMLFCAALTAGPALTMAGEEGLEDDANAKLARVKAKQRAFGSGSDFGSGSGSNAECGSLNVGNVDNRGRNSRLREVIVVVEGDVINANNNCR